MAVDVVDAFEVIEVDEQHGAVAAVSRDAGVRLTESILEEGSVRQTGQWVVNYTTTGAGAAVWDKVAHENIHQFLGIELNGVVYTAPLMQPAQTSFSTFDGRGELTGNFDRSQAMRLASALNSHKS